MAAAATTGGAGGDGMRSGDNLTPFGEHLKKKWQRWMAARVVNIKATGGTQYLYAHPEHGGRLIPITEDEYEELTDKEKSAVQRVGSYYGHAVEEGEDEDKTHFFHSSRSHEPILCAGNVGRAAFLFGEWPRQQAHLPFVVPGNYIMGISVPSQKGDGTGFCIKWHRMSDQFYHLWEAIVNGADIDPVKLDCRGDMDEVGAVWTLRKRRLAVSTLEMGARCPEYRFTYHTIAALARSDYVAPEGKTDAALKRWIDEMEW